MTIAKKKFDPDAALTEMLAAADRIMDDGDATDDAIRLAELFLLMDDRIRDGVSPRAWLRPE